MGTLEFYSMCFVIEDLGGDGVFISTKSLGNYAIHPKSEHWHINWISLEESFKTRFVTSLQPVLTEKIYYTQLNFKDKTVEVPPRHIPRSTNMKPFKLLTES